MSPAAMPDDVARALVGLGLVATGAPGPYGGWAARDAAGGPVELVVREGAPDEGRAAALTALRHDHLVPVRAVAALAGGRCGLLVGPCAGPTLAAVRGHRVPLTDGEAATVAIPLAQALDALHAAGLAFGPMEASDVVLTTDGMPRLAVPTRPFGAPDEDVRALLATVLSVMAPRTVALTTWGGDEWLGGAGLRETFEQLLAGGCRSGAEVVRVCLETVRPEPIRIPDALVAEEPDRSAALPPPPHRQAVEPTSRRPTVARAGAVAGAPGRLVRVAGSRRAVVAEPPGRAAARRAAARRAARRWRRRTVAVLAAVVLGAVAAVLLRPVDAGVALESSGAAPPEAAANEPASTASVPALAGGGTPAPADPGPAVAAGVVDPVRDRTAPAQAAAALTRLRAAALGAGDPAGLDAVDVTGGPAREDDGRLLAALDGRAEGLGADVQDARLLDGGTPPAGEVTVAVTAASTPYTLVGPDGARNPVPGGTPRTATLTLRWTDDGWRVWRVSEPTPP